MALSVKHAFHSSKGDGPDATRVKPTAWNEEHLLTTDTDGIVLGRAPGTGPGPIVPLDLSSLIPTGVVLPFAGSVAPSGFFLCYGQLVSRTTEAALFAAIGTTYGPGDGVTTFRLPDGRGVTFAGKSDMGGADRGILTGGAVLGAFLGNQVHQLTLNEMPNHNHPVTPGSTIVSGGSVNFTSPGPFNIATPETGFVGLNVPHNNVQPTLVMNFIIKR